MCTSSSMKTMGAAEFKQKCLSILDEVGPEGIVITKHGRPVAKLIPIETASSATDRDPQGKIAIKGDILSTGLRWDAES